MTARRPSLRPGLHTAVVLAAVSALAGCGRTAASTTPPPPPATLSGSPARSPVPSAPAVDIYGATAPGDFAPQTRGAKSLIYVPNTESNTVSVIDPATDRVVSTFPVGREPQHVVPAWDLRTLYVTSDRGNSLTPIDPDTGRPGRPIPVADPYNMYFTPDGRSAVVMAEAQRAVDFRDPHTFALQTRISLGSACAGVDHADFSADGSYMIVTCEFAGRLQKIDLASHRVVGSVLLSGTAAPQDIKLDPTGRTWYVSDMNSGGVWTVDGEPFRKTGFLKTGPEAHGLYPSRDGRFLYVANRGGTMIPGAMYSAHQGDAGSVSVLDFATRRVVATWPIPGGGTPDMGNVSADGRTLWLSGRRSGVVYAFDTTTGHLRATIPVGAGPHGLCVWPLPGRYSLGHTGILR